MSSTEGDLGDPTAIVADGIRAVMIESRSTLLPGALPPGLPLAPGFARGDDEDRGDLSAVMVVAMALSGWIWLVTFDEALLFTASFRGSAADNTAEGEDECTLLLRLAKLALAAPAAAVALSDSAARAKDLRRLRTTVARTAAAASATNPPATDAPMTMALLDLLLSFPAVPPVEGLPPPAGTIEGSEPEVPEPDDEGSVPELPPLMVAVLIASAREVTDNKSDGDREPRV